MQNPNQLRVLVTGATGGLGTVLLQRLESLGHTVTPLVGVDITDFDALSRAVGTTHFDVIFHLAAVTHAHDQRKYHEVNVIGTQNMLRVANLAHFIFVSSRANTRVCGAYGESKSAAEEAVRKSNLPWIILQPSEIYGGSGKEAISKLYKTVQTYRIAPIMGDGEYLVAPLWVDDFVTAAVATLTKGVPGTEYLLAGPESFTYAEMLRRMETHLNKKPLKIHIPLSALRIGAFIAKWVGSTMMVSDQIERLMCAKSTDTSAAARDLDFRPIGFLEGLKRLDNTHTAL